MNNEKLSLCYKFKNEIIQLNNIIGDVKTLRDVRHDISDVVNKVKMFLLHSIEFTSSLVALIEIIESSINHYEHEKQQKIYLKYMEELCAKDISKSIEHLLSFKFDGSKYVTLANIMSEYLVFITSISQTFSTLKNMYSIDTDINKNGPILKQLYVLVTTFNNEILCSL